MSKKLAFLIIFGAFIFNATVRAAEPPPQPQVDLGVKPTSGERADVIELVATVESVDLEQRIITLKGAEGNTVALKVSEEVKNLKKIKKGNKVVVKYYETVAWNILGKKAKVKKVKTVTETETVTEVGGKPAMAEMKELHLIATVTAKDKTVPSVTLKGPEGYTKTFKVRNPERLDLVKIGDEVDLTYTEALAVSVEKAKK
jgi:hypothetical protein